tara:strand:- start:40 stop:507 length:468 start_codon:yes stop_codon:yes gene_type:complete
VVIRTSGPDVNSHKPQATSAKLDKQQATCYYGIITERKKMSTVRKSETCEEQLRRMCRNIADGITNPDPKFIGPEDEEPRQETAGDWMEDVYDIRYIVDRDKRYLGAELMVAGGGPTIWVNLDTKYVEGYWGGDKVTEPFIDNLGLDDYCEEMYG